jgi:hypothetical protein
VKLVLLILRLKEEDGLEIFKLIVLATNKVKRMLTEDKILSMKEKSLLTKIKNIPLKEQETIILKLLWEN